jgi:hypothetical protein
LTMFMRFHILTQYFLINGGGRELYLLIAEILEFVIAFMLAGDERQVRGRLFIAFVILVLYANYPENCNLKS